MAYDPNDPNSFLMGGGAPSFFVKESPIGAKLDGIITDFEASQQTKMEDGTPLTWPDGKAKMQIVVTLQTAERDPENAEDDGLRRVFVKGQMQQAVRDAIKKAGAPGLAVGGRLVIQFTGTEPSKTKGYNDKKLYAAAYVAPTPGAEANALLADAPVDTTPAAVPAASLL